jgi:hypothetical protein
MKGRMHNERKEAEGGKGCTMRERMLKAEGNTGSWKSPAQNTYTRRDSASALNCWQDTDGGIPPETEHRCANQATRRVIGEH